MHRTALLIVAAVAIFATTTAATCSPRHQPPGPEPEPIVVPIGE